MTYAGPYSPPPQYPPARRRRRRWPWVVLALLVLLVVLFVVADRVVLKVAENRAATALQQSQNLASEPSVSFAGFPFLTQLATGKFSEVSVTAQNVVVGQDAGLHVSTVTVHLHDVTASQSYHVFHAARADADATIAYPDLSRTLGGTVADAGSGRVSVHGTVEVGGQPYTGTVVALPRVSSSRGLTFADPRVTSNGQQVPSAVSRLIADRLTQSISLQGLPFHVQVEGVDVRPTGLVLHLAGRNLTYSRS